MEVLIGMFTIIAILIGLTLGIWIKNRIKIPADEAAIVYGKKSKFVNPRTGEVKIVNSRVVSKGGATFKLPILEGVMFVDLKIIQIPLHVEDLLSANFVKVDVDAVATVKVRDDEEAIRTAATRFGNFRKAENKEKLKKTLLEILQGHLRSTISTLTPEELNSEREKFNQQVQNASGDRLAQLGIQILDFTIQVVKDKEGYLDKLREDKIAQKFKQIETGASNAEREKQKVIAENEMRIVEYHTNRKLFEEEKRGELGRTSNKMDEMIAISEINKEIELKKQDIKLKEEQNRKEELNYELEKNKQVIDASAKAESSKATAESILNIADAEATAIRLKGLAQADSKEALVNAYEKLDDSAKVLFVLEKLPELFDTTLKDDRLANIVGKVSEPLGNIDSLKIYDFGGNGNNGTHSSPIQRFSEMAPSILINLITKFKDLGFDKLVEKFNLETDILEDSEKTVDDK